MHKLPTDEHGGTPTHLPHALHQRLHLSFSLHRQLAGLRRQLVKRALQRRQAGQVRLHIWLGGDASDAPLLLLDRAVQAGEQEQQAVRLRRWDSNLRGSLARENPWEQHAVRTQPIQAESTAEQIPWLMSLMMVIT